MSATGLATVIVMVFAVTLVMSYWRQIAIFLLYVFVTVFCLGIYFIVSIIVHIWPLHSRSANPLSPCSIEHSSTRTGMKMKMASYAAQHAIDDVLLNAR
jgi:hypothetical protein